MTRSRASLLSRFLTGGQGSAKSPLRRHILSVLSRSYRATARRAEVTGRYVSHALPRPVRCQKICQSG